MYSGQPIGSLGATPLTVVQHGQQIFAAVPNDGKGIQVVWTKGQQQLAKLSSRGKLVTAPKSGHYIYVDQPALAVTLIEQAVAGR